MALISLPQTTNASVLSFITGLFNKKTAEVTTNTTDQSVQTMTLLQAAINIDPNPAKGGGDIAVVEDEALLPESGPSGTMADISSTNPYGHISIYVVRKGDTLGGIAKMFDVSTNTILWANNMSAKDLKEGQTLAILPVSGIKYTIQKGDTVQSIAKKYKADADEINTFNSITEGEKLAIGDEIIIPDGEATQIAVSSNSTKPTAPLHGASGPSYPGYYIRPLVGGHKTQGLHGYNAVDIGTPVGTPILAAAAGTIIISRSSGWNSGYGNYVAIEHANNTETVYGHLSQPLVTVGDTVVQGQVIGLSGNTGKSTGPHLHFEIRGAKNPF